MTYIVVLIRVERSKVKDNREFTLGYQPFAYTRLTVCLYSNGRSPILKSKNYKNAWVHSRCRVEAYFLQSMPLNIFLIIRDLYLKGVEGHSFFYF